MSSRFFFVFLGFAGVSESDISPLEGDDDKVVGKLGGFVVVEVVSVDESFFATGFFNENRDGFEGFSSVIGGRNTFGFTLGEGAGDGTGDLSLLFSRKEGVLLLAGGLGLVLSGGDESEPPPKLFAFLNLIVTVSAAEEIGGSP